jgi:hypothetical protein
LLNHDPKGVISKQLYKLKKNSLYRNEGSIKNIENIEKFAAHVAKIHSYSINKDNFEIYNAQWVIEQVCKIKDAEYKADVISALEAMSQIEVHNAPPKEIRFLAWDIIRSDWQEDYQSGKAGSCAWDIACIINCANDAQFSEIFLKSYLGHGGEKPALVELYANLYYVKVIEAVKIKDFENIIGITREIIDDTMFNTDIISYETLLKLNITGY